MNKTLRALLILISLPVWAVDFRQSDKSDNLSQFIRSNAPHYWHYMRVEADLAAVKKFLLYDGTVMGDPHLGNFAPLPIADATGRRHMEFVNIDFDDAGTAPFILDYIRYVVAVEATFPKSKKRDLEEAYVKGLNGKSVKAPESLNEITDVTVAQYDEMVTEHLEKSTDSAGFKLKDGKLEAYRGRIKREEMAKAFPGKKVIDIARRLKDRGGSADGIRIWVLTEDSAGKRAIMELKEWEKPGVSHYQNQPATGVWLREVRAAFWPGLDGSSYDLTEIDGTLFWVRPKGQGLVDVPYSSEKREKMEFAADLAVFDANLLGLAHGRQRESARYLEEVQSDREAFHEAVETIIQDYLKIAKRAYNRQELK